MRVKDLTENSEIIDPAFFQRVADESSRLRLHEMDYDIIGIGGLTTQTRYIADMAKMVREEFPDAVIIGGGGFMSAQPREMMRWIPEFDVGFVGEAYNTFREFLAVFNGNQNWSKIKGTVYREGTKIKLGRMRELIPEEKMDEEIPYPAYEYSMVEAYLQYSAMTYSPIVSGLVALNVREQLRRLDVMSSLGCPLNCSFCFHLGATPSCQSKIYNKTVTGKAVRKHSPKYVVNLIGMLRQQYGVNFVSFIDENFTVNKQWFYDFCSELENADLSNLIHWGVVGHANTVDAEMLSKGHDVGMSYISYGGETASPTLLKTIGKLQTPDQMANAIAITHAAKITPIMSFILGFPEETIEDVIATTQFFIDNQINCGPFLLQPYPGTVLFEKYKDKIIAEQLTEEEKEILDKHAMLEATANDFRIRDDALKRWIFSLDDAVKISCNISQFSDMELLGLKQAMEFWDIKRLKAFKKQFELQKITEAHNKFDHDNKNERGM
jgi:anaerobic magnesium-protoporphyrin IX monomethyl ester cyclase